MKKLFVVLAMVMALAGCKSKPNVDLSVEGDFDIEKYLGEWYEIARFDFSYERGMTRCKSVYAVRWDGVMEFVSTGIKHGEPKYAKGGIKTSDVPRILRFSYWGPTYSDYRILMIDEDYTWALIGGDDAKHLWILSRTPEMQEPVRDTILAEAARRGFDTGKFVGTEQK